MLRFTASKPFYAACRQLDEAGVFYFNRISIQTMGQPVLASSRLSKSDDVKAIA
jgi:hypothetical protein